LVAGTDERDTGRTVDLRGVDLWEVRDQRIVRGTIGFADRESAVEAVASRNQAETS
jgi:hypothetical protein